MDQTIRYEVSGTVATITLDRPDAANAQSSQLITELDAAFDRAEADDAVRVIVLAAEGKHFSAGHDLKEILAGEGRWAAMRATPEGKQQLVMFFHLLDSSSLFALGRGTHRGPVLLAREDLLEVVAGGEVLALGHEHDHPHGVVGLGAVERGVELGDQLRLLRVRGVGSVERDGRERPRDLVPIV